MLSLSAQVFDVVVQETQGSKRLNLENCGKYKLFVTMASLGLEDLKSREIIGRWHFEFIRRYGFTKSRNLFTIEAGRRCETGEGTFDFHIVGNPKALTLAIDNATKAKHSRTMTSQLTHGLEQNNSSKEPPAKVRDSTKSVKTSRKSELSRKSSDSLSSDNSKENQSEDDTQTPSTLQLSFKNSLEATISSHPTSPKPQKEGSGKEKKRGFSFPWRRDKSEKKDQQKGQEGNEGHKSQEIENESSDLYDEPELNKSNKASMKLKKAEPIYDEAGDHGNTSPGGHPPVYSEPTKVKSEAWKKQGANQEHHEEDYKKIKDAALKDGGNLPHLPDRPYDEDEEETYDRVALKADSKPRKPSKPALAAPEHIYGIGSGKNIEDIDDEGDYASADFDNEQVAINKTVKTPEPDEENDYEFENVDDDTYADTMNPSEDYADAMSCIRSDPPPRDPPPRPQLYEDVA